MSRIRLNRTNDLPDLRDAEIIKHQHTIDRLLTVLEDRSECMNELKERNKKLAMDGVKLNHKITLLTERLAREESSEAHKYVNVRVLGIKEDVVTMGAFIETTYIDGEIKNQSCNTREIRPGSTYQVKIK